MRSLLSCTQTYIHVIVELELIDPLKLDSRFLHVVHKAYSVVSLSARTYSAFVPASNTLPASSSGVLEFVKLSIELAVAVPMVEGTS